MRKEHLTTPLPTEHKIRSINTHSRTRIIVESDGSSMVDQSLAHEYDINNIVRNWKITNTIPDHLVKANLKYLDCTQVTSFQDIQDKIANAKSHFNQLPAGAIVTGKQIGRAHV